MIQKTVLLTRKIKIVKSTVFLVFNLFEDRGI